MPLLGCLRTGLGNDLAAFSLWGGEGDEFFQIGVAAGGAGWAIAGEDQEFEGFITGFAVVVEVGHRGFLVGDLWVDGVRLLGAGLWLNGRALWAK